MIRELLLPHTDAGVAVQVATVVAATVVVSLLLRRESSLVTLTIGLGMVLLGLMGLRALH